MRIALVVVATMLASIATFGQDQNSCKAFFQLVHADAGSPGLNAGMSPGEKRWWDNEGQKKYPGLCLNGSVMNGDRPRYLLIWSKSKSIGPGSVPPNDVYNQPSNALSATAPKEWIYQPRWNVTSITIAYVLYDGSLEIPPIHFTAGDHTAWFFPDERKALKEAVRYLSQEPIFQRQTP